MDGFSLCRHLPFIVPDRCHDMHSCSAAEGDSWLASFPPASSPANRCRREGCCFTFDEGTSDDHVATLVIDPRIRAASRFTAPYDHYSLVGTIEDVFGL